ncbi:unnamed protein product [Mytilus coruscus]|uniref:Uncharacterized protein n=1 Tax=Mytilus coruscus TaxID=42192 RepID=A0A6J8EDB6_MYTCO|nr:unnamed protein product [Mytilus coruscus]
MSLSEHKHILMPVKREDCEIPEDLEFFTWIDAREDIDLWFPQFLAAINAPVDAGFTQPFLQFHKTSTSSCCGEAFQTRYIPDYLRRSGIDFNPEVLTEHVAKVSSTRLVKQRVFINPIRLSCVMADYFIINVFLVGMAMLVVYVFAPFDGDNPFLFAGLSFALTSGILGIVWPCYCYASKRKEYIKEHHVRHHADETRVKIVDEDDTNEVNERTSLIGVNTRAIDIEEEVLDKILDMSVSYFDKFLSGKLSHPRNIRHSRRAICLCQFLEEINKACKEPNTQHNIIEV